MVIGRVDGVEAPGRFRWRHRWWQVVRVQARWVRTSDWWDGPAARALRGEAGDAGASPADLETEVEHWRVEARVVGQARTGVFDIACAAGVWAMTRVHD